MVDTVRSFGGFRSKNDAGIAPLCCLLCCPILSLRYAAPGSVYYLTIRHGLDMQGVHVVGEICAGTIEPNRYFCVFVMIESRWL